MLKQLTKNLYVLLFICLTVLVSAQTATAKTDLKIKGTVVAYWFASEALPKGSFLGVTDIFIVKVLKVVKGKQKSKFLVASFLGNRDDYPVLEFTADKVFEFNLEKFDIEEAGIERLMYTRTFDENNNIIIERNDLEFVNGFDERSIPKDLLLPQYFVTQK